MILYWSSAIANSRPASESPAWELPNCRRSCLLDPLWERRRSTKPVAGKGCSGAVCGGDDIGEDGTITGVLDVCGNDMNRLFKKEDGLRDGPRAYSPVEVYDTKSSAAGAFLTKRC